MPHRSARSNAPRSSGCFREHLGSSPLRATPNRRRLADVIDTLTMYPDAPRKVLRLLGEIDAAS